MKVLVSGSSGLIGSALLPRLRAAGHDVVRLVRHAPDGRDEVHWSPEERRFDAQAAAGCAAVVHLAGENVASGIWTASRRRRIRESRVIGTRLLAEGLAALPEPPRVWVGASAIGAYGDRGEALLTEDSDFGTGFFPDVCREWEAASAAIEPHARRVILRFGVVLDPSGGALAVMRRPFKLGLGGRLGSGRQWMSWITLEDVCGIVLRALHDDTWRGIYNAVAPHPVRNTDFARELGRALRRPAKLPVPATALRMVLGGAMADEMLLASARVVPERLRAAGFRFRDPVLGDALRRLLARPRA